MRREPSILYKSMLFHAAMPLFALFAVHTIGVYAHLYYMFPWYDIMTHIWGGIVIGFLVLAAMARILPIGRGMDMYSARNQWLWIGIIVAIALGWELYEYIINNVIAGRTFEMLDTCLDIINDHIGALIALAWARIFVLPRF